MGFYEAVAAGSRHFAGTTRSAPGAGRDPGDRTVGVTSDDTRLPSVVLHMHPPHEDQAHAQGQGQEQLTVHHMTKHSVVAEHSSLAGRELIVYDARQVYPEYLLEVDGGYGGRY